MLLMEGPMQVQHKDHRLHMTGMKQKHATAMAIIT